jgi:hypothetical protein
MSAMVACMNKWLLYAFAVMKRRETFQVDHVRRSPGLATASSISRGLRRSRRGTKAHRCLEPFARERVRRNCASPVPLPRDSVRMRHDEPVTVCCDGCGWVHLAVRLMRWTAISSEPSRRAHRGGAVTIEAGVDDPRRRARTAPASGSACGWTRIPCRLSDRLESSA